MPANGRSCSTCEYLDGAAGIDGYCHRLPPVLLVTKNRTADINQREYEEVTQNYTYVGPDDWCGEYRQQPIGSAYVKGK